MVWGASRTLRELGPSAISMLYPVPADGHLQRMFTEGTSLTLCNTRAQVCLSPKLGGRLAQAAAPQQWHANAHRPEKLQSCTGSGMGGSRDRALQSERHPGAACCLPEVLPRPGEGRREGLGDPLSIPLRKSWLCEGPPSSGDKAKTSLTQPTPRPRLLPQELSPRCPLGCLSLSHHPAVQLPDRCVQSRPRGQEGRQPAPPSFNPHSGPQGLPKLGRGHGKLALSKSLSLPHPALRVCNSRLSWGPGRGSQEAGMGLGVTLSTWVSPRSGHLCD